MQFGSEILPSYILRYLFMYICVRNSGVVSGKDVVKPRRQSDNWRWNWRCSSIPLTRRSQARGKEKKKEEKKDGKLDKWKDLRMDLAQVSQSFSSFLFSFFFYLFPPPLFRSHD